MTCRVLKASFSGVGFEFNVYGPTDRIHHWLRKVSSESVPDKCQYTINIRSYFSKKERYVKIAEMLGYSLYRSLKDKRNITVAGYRRNNKNFLTIYHILTWIISDLLFEKKRYMVLHAGLASRGRKTVIIPGERGAGKTTTLLWLYKHGFKVNAGDKCIFSRNNGSLFVSSFGDDMKIKRGTFKSFPGLKRYRKLKVEKEHRLVPTDIIFNVKQKEFGKLAISNGFINPVTDAYYFMKLINSSTVFSPAGSDLIPRKLNLLDELFDMCNKHIRVHRNSSRACINDIKRIINRMKG